MTKFFVFLVVLSALCVSSLAQNYTPTKVSVSTNSQFFPLSELKEGMKGTARTVFRGSVAEEFNVEIPDDAAEKIQTVGDAVNFITQNSAA